MGSEETPGMKTVLIMPDLGWPLKVNWTPTEDARIVVPEQVFSAAKAFGLDTKNLKPMMKLPITPKAHEPKAAATRHERRAREAETKKLERRMSKVKK